MPELTPHDEVRLFFQQIRRPLLTEDGQALLEYLEQRFCERRHLVNETAADGTVYQQLLRTSGFVPGDSHATAKNEGNREVVLFLKDLQEMEG